jgi:hypothetical protein
MTILDKLSSISSFSAGISLTVIRLHEPYFKFMIKKSIYGFFGILMDDREME